MMDKSRKTTGRRTRMGLILALALLILPAPALAGVEWTMDDPGSAGRPSDDAADGHSKDVRPSSILVPEADRTPQRDPILDDANGGGPSQVRGVEWT